MSNRCARPALLLFSLLCVRGLLRLSLGLLRLASLAEHELPVMKDGISVALVAGNVGIYLWYHHRKGSNGGN
jgi:hypothetical protein